MRITPRRSGALVSLALVGATVGIVSQSHHSSSSHPVRGLHLVTDSSPTGYPTEGVSLAAPALPLPPAAPAAASADTVMQSLRAQQPAQGLLGSSVSSSDYTVTQQSVTETMPEGGTGVVAGVPFDAWVVTYNGVAPVSLSGNPAPAGLSCRFVAIMSIATGTWTEWFSSC
jgi:hypothetical protein